MSLKDPSQIPHAFKVKTSHYIIAGLSLVTALSWNEAVKQSIKSVYVLPKDLIWGNIIYAFVITIVLIIVIYLLPDTKSELPVDTQAKINQAEALQGLKTIQDQVTEQNKLLWSMFNR